MKRVLLILGMVVALVGFMAVVNAMADPLLDVTINGTHLGNVTSGTSGDITLNSASATGLLTGNSVVADLGATVTATGAGSITLTMTYGGLTLSGVNQILAQITPTGSVEPAGRSATESYYGSVGVTGFSFGTFSLNSNGTVPAPVHILADISSQPFSIIQTETITFTSAGSAVTSTDNSVSAVPEPPTLLLFGVGLLGLGIIGLRRKHEACASSSHMTRIAEREAR